MQPLNLPENRNWRVVYIGRFKRNDSKNSFVCNVFFEEIENLKSIPKEFKLSTSEKRQVNLNQIKFFRIGSIWRNNSPVIVQDEFETYTIQNNRLNFRQTPLQVSAFEYLSQNIVPVEKLHVNFKNSFSLSVYDIPSSFKFEKIESEKYNPTFIAIPCYEIVRYFLLGVNLYNQRLLQSNLFEAEHNKIFDNPSSYFVENEKKLYFTAKLALTKSTSKIAGDIVDSFLFRYEVHKLIKELYPRVQISKIKMPIKKYSKISFKAKRVKNKHGSTGLLLLYFTTCKGHRRFNKIEYDNIASFSKLKLNETNKKPKDSTETSVRIINTGSPENYIEDAETNNYIPSVKSTINNDMLSLIEDYDDIKSEKVKHQNKTNRPPTIQKMLIDSNIYSLRTEESDSSNNISPLDFSEKKKKLILNQNEKRSESDKSPMYRLRFFQDFGNIVEQTAEILNEGEDCTAKILFSNKEFEFKEKLNRINIKSCEFVNSKTKFPRKIFLLQVYVNNRFIYILEPEFLFENSSKSTLIFYYNNFKSLKKYQLKIFIKKYIDAQGQKNRLNDIETIENYYKLEAINHGITKPSINKKKKSNKNNKKKKNSDTEIMNVSEAITKHSEKLAGKIKKIANK